MKNQDGNVFLYILIAVALFAGLSFVMSRGQDGGEKTVLDQATLKTTAQRLTAYVDQASQAWLQMHETGTDLDELTLILPSNGVFNSASTIHNLFHPDGGGLTYREMNDDTFRASATTPVGWKFALVNADWTATTGTDLLLTYVNVKPTLCAELNRIIRNDATIPTVTVNFTNTFTNGSAALTEVACPDCKVQGSLCVQNTGVYAFYNLIEAR